jgi:hypothetical protein
MTGSPFAGWMVVDVWEWAHATMNAPKIVAATFTAYTSIAFKSGAGGGAVTSSPAGINCGVDRWCVLEMAFHNA